MIKKIDQGFLNKSLIIGNRPFLEMNKILSSQKIPNVPKIAVDSFQKVGIIDDIKLGGGGVKFI
jgi:hypothetical protein